MMQNGTRFVHDVILVLVFLVSYKEMFAVASRYLHNTYTFSDILHAVSRVSISCVFCFCPWGALFISASVLSILIGKQKAPRIINHKAYIPSV